MTQNNENKITNILLGGVGGQGILLASKIISEAALMEGYDVKANEIHGMAQRGGSVIAQIRFGKKVYSPLVKIGTAQILVAMEIIEGVRYAKYLAPGGKAFINVQQIIPTTVSSGLAAYPADPVSMVKESIPGAKIADCLKLAQDAGSAKCVNSIMCGWISGYLPFQPETWQKVMEKKIKPRFIEMNKKAFQLGQGLEL